MTSTQLAHLTADPTNSDHEGEHDLQADVLPFLPDGWELTSQGPGMFTLAHPLPGGEVLACPVWDMTTSDGRAAWCVGAHDASGEPTEPQDFGPDVTAPPAEVAAFLVGYLNRAR